MVKKTYKDPARHGTKVYPEKIPAPAITRSINIYEERAPLSRTMKRLFATRDGRNNPFQDKQG